MTINRVNKKRYTDAEIIEGLKIGNDAILNFLYKNYYGAVRSLVLKSYGTEEQAKDIFQEVIIVIYNKLQKSDFKITSSFFTFFYAVIRISWLNYGKTKKQNPITFAKDFNDDLDGSLDKDELESLANKALRSNLVQSYLRKMSDGCQIILRFFLADYSSEEIAIELGLKSAGYVRKRKSKCLEQLIEDIRKDAVFKELL
jgi:RNA polymerase sigma factor (sigma-70 family)